MFIVYTYLIVGLIVACLAYAGQAFVFGWSVFAEWRSWLAFFFTWVSWPYALYLIIQACRGK